MPDVIINGVLSRKAGGHNYYFGTLDASALRSLTYVPLNEENPKPCPYLNEQQDGYQRWGSATRMRAFKNYLASHPSQFIPPLLLSAKDWTFVPDTAGGKFGALHANGLAAIVDGQHRAGGFIAHFEEDEIDRSVDFICYVGLDRSAEEQLFLDINTTQRGVDKGLSAYLRGGEGVVIAEALNTLADSPFRGRVSKQAGQKGQLFKFHSFIQGLEKTFKHGKLEHLSVDDRVDALIQYWSIIADVFADFWEVDVAILDSPDGGRQKMESKLLELTGFLTWSNLGPALLGEAYSETHGFHWETIRTRIQACEAFDWRKHGQYQGRTGTAGASYLKAELERLIPTHDHIPLTDM
jgi:DNA sulfur modification protein DndB